MASDGGVTCSRCGVVGPRSARFCAACGGPLGPVEPAADVRKTVTAVFCDVTGSTALARQLDAEAMREVMEQYFGVVSTVLTRHGGTVEKFVGDAVMAVFGVPVTHEDDAVRACRAALGILAAVGEVDRRVEAVHGARFGVRIGVETGEVVVGDSSRRSTFASGTAVHTAARLEQAAGPGECLIGPECFRLVRDVAVVAGRPGLVLKGMVEPLDAFLLVEVGEPADDRPVSGPLVGRSRELALLRQSFDRALGDRTCQLVTVLGPAGMGKSRLAAEFLAGVAGEATVLRGRCVAYGEGVTYWPLVEAVRQAAGLSGTEDEQQARLALIGLLGGLPDAREVVERVAPVAGLGGAPGSPEDTAWAVRRLLEAVAAERPVVLAVDDLHWAEPGLVRILEALCDWSHDAPILVLVLARPEFLDERPGWAGGRVNALSALLEPLRDEEVDQLSAGVLGGVLSGEAADRVREAAGGNPLFVEQVLAMLVDDGVLADGGTGWALTDEVAALAIPPTISALLAARLDRLSAQERAVLAPASVIGQVFYLGAVAELSRVELEDVPGLLRSLVRKGLVRPVRSDLPGQDGFTFGHVLIRDAAYAGLPKLMRAELHERFARWLDTQHDGQVFDDFVGGHLEAAYRLRAELGAVDEPTRRLGQEAAGRLAAAGQRLLFADDGAAMALLERADRLRTDQGPDRWAAQIEIARAYWRNSLQLDQAAALAERVRVEAEAAGDQRWVCFGRLVAAQIRLSTDPVGATEVLHRECLASLELFTGLDDHYGISVAHIALGDVANMAAHISEQVDHTALAAEHAELAGRHSEAQLYQQVTLTRLMYGDCPADRGLAESRRLLEQAEHRAARAFSAAAVSFFATLLGRQEEAAEAHELAARLSAELRGGAARGYLVATSLAELFTGRWPVAVRVLAETCANDERAGDLAVLSTDGAMLAHALLHTGAPEPAREQVERSQRVGADDDVWTQALVSSAQAWLAALDGDGPGYRHRMSVATRLAPGDGLPMRALMHEAFAEASLALGDASGATAHRKVAIDLHRAKGNLVSVARLQEVL